MNSLEAEYSYLAPTWKPPSNRTSLMHPGPSYVPSLPKISPNSSTRNQPMQNSRYAPPNGNRRVNPNQQLGPRPMQLPPSQQSNGHHRTYEQLNNNTNNNFDSNDEYQVSIQMNSNDYSPPPPPSQPTQKRVQIVDHNYQTPLSEHESQNSRSPQYNQKQLISKSHRNHIDDNKSDSTLHSTKHPNNFNIHEYLYGLAAPDPGSYVSAFKNQRRRLEDEKVNRKSVLTEYKTFVQNGGFGPAFGSVDYLTYEEKLDTEKKRKSYSKFVREVNQYKVEEHKRLQNNGGQPRPRHYVVPPPKHRLPGVKRPNFLSPHEVRDFERRIKLEHDANCKCSLHANPHHPSN